jgi:hypothetical protein
LEKFWYVFWFTARGMLFFRGSARHAGFPKQRLACSFCLLQDHCMCTLVEALAGMDVLRFCAAFVVMCFGGFLLVWCFFRLF